MANPQAPSGVSRTIYNTFFKRNSVFIGTMFVSAFAFGLAYTELTQRYWDTRNSGKQWKDIRHKYTESSATEE